MPPTNTSDLQAEITQFIKASLHGVVRAEADGRIPPRFTGAGVAVWSTFRNELNAADLVALCIQDAGVTMPVPFDPSRWWPDWPDWALLGYSPADAERWIEEALAQADQSRDAYVRQQAAASGIELPLQGRSPLCPPRPATSAGWNYLARAAGWLMPCAHGQTPRSTFGRTSPPFAGRRRRCCWLA